MKRWLLPASVVILGAGIAAYQLSRAPSAPSDPSITEKPVPPRSPGHSAPTEIPREVADAAIRRTVHNDWDDLLAWLNSNPPPDSAAIRQRLLETRAAWAAMDPHPLAAAIAELLRTGADLSTGLHFRVGPHGFLASWPSMRIFLLDALVTADPESAAIIARDVLSTTTSGSEYAVALRSLTREGLGRADDSELLIRFDHMLQQSAWHNDPGFAEALDLARLIGSPESAKRLANFQGNQEMKSMAMDEFAAQHPAAMIEALGESSLIDATQRATLMARADPADPRQAAAVDAYLRNPALAPDEATRFFRAFPLRSTTTGFRLFAQTPAPYQRDRIAASDRAALTHASKWARDPALANYQPEILALTKRLADWVSQAENEEPD